MIRALALALALPAGALAHGSAPRVVELVFPPQAPELVWALTDQQGLFGDWEGARRWLCEDVAAPLARFNGIAPVDDALQRWVVTADAGVFRTLDAGCNFERVEGIERPIALRTGDGVLLTATAAEDQRNDVWRSVDAGATWAPVGLAIEGAVSALFRESDAVRLSHPGGVLHSDDAGERFIPLDAPAGLTLVGLRFGTTTDAEATRLYREDADAWAEVLSVGSPVVSLLVDGERGLLSTLFDGVYTTADAGASWQRAEALDVPRLGCLTRAPDGALWACSDIFQGGPWATARSEDFGRSWAPRMANFVDVETGWLCDRDSDAFAACNQYCAAVVSGGVCEREPDAGVPDAATADADADVGVPDVSVPDAGLADAGRAPHRDDSGCKNAPGSTPWLLLFFLALAGRRR